MVSPAIVWRDDDIGAGTVGQRLDHLREVDDLFQHYRAPHTVSVLAAGLSDDHPVVRLIRDRRMVVQLHGWDHEALVTPETVEKLPAAVERLTALFGAPPSVIYPPWNQSSPWLQVMASRLRLTISTEKESLTWFLRTRTCSTGVLNFRYWSAAERVQLADALRIAYEKH